MTSDHTEPRALAEAIDRELRARGSAARAEKEKSYLKSELVHYGVSVPDTRSIVRAALRGAGLSHDEVVDLAEQLWAEPRHDPVHERRTAAQWCSSSRRTASAQGMPRSSKPCCARRGPGHSSIPSPATSSAR